MKKLVLIFCIFLTNPIAALELTLKVNYWLQELTDTYTVHTDEYIYLVCIPVYPHCYEYDLLTIG